MRIFFAFILLTFTASIAAAQKIEALVKKGTDLGTALASLGLPLPPVDQVNLPREQVQQMGQQTPPPLAMLFYSALAAMLFPRE